MTTDTASSSTPTPPSKFLACLASPLLWGVLATALLTAFRAPWVYPGEGAIFLAQVTGALPHGGAILHPLATLVGTTLASVLPMSCVVAAFNTVAVLLGGACVGLLCAIVKGLMTFAITEPNSRRWRPRAVAFAIPAAAIALVLSPTFFLASTHFQWQQVDLFFLLVAAQLVVRALLNGNTKKLALAACCVGVVTAAYLPATLLTPLFILGLIRAYALHTRRPNLRQLSTTLLLPMVLGALVTTCIAGALSAILSDSGAFIAGAKHFLAAQGAELYALSAYEGWILLALFGVLPGILALLTGNAIGQNTRTLPILGTYLTLAIFAGVTFLPVEVAPLALASEWKEVYPVTICMLTAFAIAFVFGAGILFTHVKRPAECASERRIARVLSRRVALGLLIVMPVAVLGFGGVRLATLLAAETQVNALPRTVADHILSAADGKELWLLSDGTLDPYLALRIAETEAPVTLLSYPQEQLHPKATKAQLLALLENSAHLKAAFAAKPELKQILEYAIGDLGGLQPFLQDWLRHDPTAAEVFVTLNRPELWFSGKRYPIPEELWYRGVATYGDQLAALPPKQTLAEPEVNEELPYTSRIFADYIRRQMSLQLCHAAQILMTTDRKPEAYQLFRKAYDLDIANTPAIIGAYILIKSDALGPETDALKADEAYCLKEIKASKWLSPRYKERLTDPASILVTPSALEQLLMSWAKAGQDPSILFEDETLVSAAQQNVWGRRAQSYERIPGRRRDTIDAYQKHLASVTSLDEELSCLLKLVRLNLLEGKVPEAKNLLEQAAEVAQQIDQKLYAEYLKLSEQERQQLPAPKVSALLDYDYAIYAIATGDSAKARNLLQTFLTRQPGNIDALALLATLQLQEGEVKQVRDITMKQLVQAAKTTDTYQIKLLQAQLAERDGDFKGARTAYLRAYELNPQTYALRDAILRLDMALMDATAAREHARDFLVRDREHPLSNYIMGSLALQENDLDRALFYLQMATASTTETPPPEAFNDLAETYRRRGRWADALNAARQALTVAPDLAIAHETAAAALLELNRFEEAHQELNAALAIEQRLRPNDAADPRIGITRARLYVKEGKDELARQALLRVRKQYQQLDASSKADFDGLAQHLNLRF